MSSSDYIGQIQQLVELQKVDDEIFTVRQRMDNAPQDLKSLEQKFKSVEDRRNHILDKLSHLQEQKKRLAIEIEDDSSKINKSKSKLMQVGNAREYQAVQKEMDSMERINRSREEEKNTLLEELRIQTSHLEEIDKEYETVKADLDKKRETMDISLEADKAELQKLAGRRELVSKNISLPIFMRYEFIRKRLEHPVIVQVEDGICSGCHIAIPPQTFIELQMGQQILSCPNCQRLIYWNQHFEDPYHSGEKSRKKLNQEEKTDIISDEENSIDKDQAFREDEQEFISDMESVLEDEADYIQSVVADDDADFQSDNEDSKYGDD